MLSVSESLTIAASPEQVFRAWTHPELLTAWYPERIDGELAVGQAATLVWTSLGVQLPVTVRELVEPSLFELTAQVADVTQTQRVRIAARADRALVTVEHSGLRNEDEAAGTRSGWRLRLAVLRDYLERHAGASRTSFAILGLAPVSPETLFARYITPTWLGEATLGDVGSAWTLDVGGVVLTGEVIARCEGRELGVRCAELDAALSFRSLPAAGARLCGIEVSSWSRDEGMISAVRPHLERAVQRLVTELGGEMAGLS